MVDPITFEVVRGALLTLAGEIKASVMHTAYSTVVAVGGDLSCGVSDGRGRLVAQGQDIPAQLGALPLSIRATIETIGLEKMGPGDAFISNDPYAAGSNHLNDVLMVMPVFAEGRLVAFSAARSHWLDIGGPNPGAMNTRVRDIYSEGLRIPPVAVYRDYRYQDHVGRLVLLNTRNRTEREWDMRAQFAGCMTGERGIHRLCERYGTDVVVECMSTSLDYSEQRLRSCIAQLPDGVYRFEDWMEGDGFTDYPVKLACAVTIRGEEIAVDFSGTDPQVKGGLNAAWAVTEGITHYVIKAVTDYTIPSNEGCQRPITVTAPAGCVLNPIEPAPCSSGGTSETASRLADLLIGCFAQAVPERVLAASSGTSGVAMLSGPDPDAERGRLLRRDTVVQLETHRGGLGARPEQDGVNGIAVHIGNTRTTPVEMLEFWAPLRVRRWEMVPDSGGAGRRRGGTGTVREYEVLGEGWTFTILGERARVPAFGIEGGLAGGIAAYVVEQPGHEPTALNSKHPMTELAEGARLTVQVAGGGGFGHPFDRDPDLVLRDVQDGVVSVDAAVRDYGVVVIDGMTVDREATARLRADRDDTGRLDRGDIRYPGMNGALRHAWTEDQAAAPVR
jgi:N-methylhydantoinase B